MNVSTFRDQSKKGDEKEDGKKSKKWDEDWNEKWVRDKEEGLRIPGVVLEVVSITPTDCVTMGKGT